jgi:hypothetical protein
MSKAIRTAVLVLLLASSAQAGYIPNGSPTPPPPTQPASTVQETNAPTLNGEMSTPGVTENVAEIALELLAVLPSLL